jgi:hypothetical protein
MLRRVTAWVLAGCAVACAGQGVLLLPSGVAYDSAGNLYVADARRHQVFEVALSGVTTVVAGTGVQGFGGDGGAAALALLDAPGSVAVGSDGKVYIADTGNQRVRAVSAGVIRTVAGSGVRGFSGDGGDARAAMLSGPVAVAVDAQGGLLIADSGNHRLRRLSSGVLTTVAGTGVQGFAGDGGAATVAELDTPAGVAVAGDGRVFVVDSHNHRVRVIATDGTIATFAGSGVRGFGGDGTAATGAMLWLPRGVAVMGGGVVFADSDNQRLRMVDAQGIISTVAGSGVQGSSAEGAVGTAAALDSPRGVAVSGFAAPVFADAHNAAVREVAADAKLYALLGGASHVATVTLNAPGALTYGQGTVGVTVGGAAPVAQGSVALLDGGVAVSSAALAGGVVVLPADTLSAGQHTLSAAFAGDGVHGATVSAGLVVSVAPLPAVATAQAATMTYGSATPALTGTLSGILVRDAANVAANFVSSAPDLSPVGTYPIAASLTGVASGDYSLTVSANSGALLIVPSAAVVTVGTPAVAYAGLPLTLTAVVGPATRGTPSGVVTFSDVGSVVGVGNVVGGAATVVLLAPSAGAHAITALYGGDHNFLATTSAVSSITVSAMPDFSLAVSGSGAQTVLGGAIATYTLQVAAQPGPFSGSVTMSASGLQTGATATFSPVAVVPGNSSAMVTMSVQTIALAERKVRNEAWFAGLVGLVMLGCRRRRLLGASVMMGLIACVGCGDRSFSGSQGAARSFPITVTATATNLAGAVVTHTASVVVVVQ